MTDHRDIDLFESAGAGGAGGRKVIAVIGIDRYQSWPTLSNAVNDAKEARRAFRKLGFEELTEPLFDGDATRDAIHSLVTDELRGLQEKDSLVLFYAGHGGNRKHQLEEKTIKSGYLIPADARNDPDKVATWIELGSWLEKVSLLPARHILVILDACYSGIALGSGVTKERGDASQDGEPLSTLSRRRSRRIITSALPDERALDSGPIPGNSLFTGYLIEGLEDGLARGGRREATGMRIGEYVQWRVREHTSSKQTPDFGTFAHDDRGELVIPLLGARAEDDAAPGAPPPTRRTDAARGSRATGPSGLSWAIAIVMTLFVGGIAALMAIGASGDRSQARLPSDEKTQESAGAAWHELMSTPAADGGPVSFSQNESAADSRRLPVVVKSDPSGAMAKLVRTSQSGPTPKTFTRLLATQKYRVTIEKPGFHTKDIVISPEEGDPPVVTLKRKPVYLRVTSDPPGATIWLSQWRRRKRTTPVDIPLSVDVQQARRVRILLEKEGYRREEREVVLDRLVEQPDRMVQEEVVGLHPIPSSTAARAER